MPLTSIFPSTIYAYIDTYPDPHMVITTDPPPHGSRCAQYVLNNIGISKITVELEDK